MSDTLLVELSVRDLAKDVKSSKTLEKLAKKGSTILKKDKENVKDEVGLMIANLKDEE